MALLAVGLAAGFGIGWWLMTTRFTRWCWRYEWNEASAYVKLNLLEAIGPEEMDRRGLLTSCWTALESSVWEQLRHPGGD